ncbi:MAG: lantibiotic dehydratase family protein, partial [Bacteroidales bacterium]|nr:lantibiotic dehydratase family protein [Bacteroidales bacterium]
MIDSIPYVPFKNFILRTPLYPIDFLKPFTQKRITPIKQLKNLCSIPIIKEALFLAPPDLYYEIQKWLKGEITNKKESEKIQYAVMRYLL